MWILVYLWKSITISFFEWSRDHKIWTLLCIIIGFAPASIVASIAPLSAFQKLGLGLGVWFFALVLVVTPWRMWKRESDSLARLGQHGIELVFDEKCPGCIEVTNHYSSVGPREQVGTAIMYRMGIMAKGQKTVESVRILVEAFAPQGAAYLPKPLRMKYCAGSVLDIHPGATPTGFVDFINWWKGSSQFVVCFDDGNRQIPAGGYTFVLVGQGRDMAPYRQRFDLTLDRDQLRIRPTGSG